jgi:hypothetical protein
VSSDDKRPPTPDEERAARELAEALAEGHDPLGEALMSALRPGELDDDVHERILEAALSGKAAALATPEPLATPKEAAEAARLRDSLARDAGADGVGVGHPLAELARAVKNAHEPRPIAQLRNEALLRPALRAPTRSQARRTLSGVVVTALAIAAGLFLYVRGREQHAPQAHVAPPDVELFLPGMVEERTTAPMFEREDFPPEGGHTTRIDRITEARSSDLRQNRFVSWGIE